MEINKCYNSFLAFHTANSEIKLPSRQCGSPDQAKSISQQLLKHHEDMKVRLVLPFPAFLTTRENVQ